MSLMPSSRPPRARVSASLLPGAPTCPESIRTPISWRCSSERQRRSDDPRRRLSKAMIRSRRRAETRAPSRRAHPMMACCANIPMSSLSRPRGLGVLRRNSLLQLPIRTERAGFCAVWLVRQLDVRDSAHFILFASWTCKNLRGSPRAAIDAHQHRLFSARCIPSRFARPSSISYDLQGKKCSKENSDPPYKPKKGTIPCANS